jgi:hypothetical protein
MRKTQIQMREFDEYKLEAHERPTRVYEYHVTGSGRFPVDMLRHDSAWPATSADAGIIEQCSIVMGQRVSVKVRSYRQPTIARWHSYGWRVSAEMPESVS